MRSKRQAVAAGGNGLSLIQALFAAWAPRTFATGCAPSVPQLFHPNRPKNARFGFGNDRQIEVDVIVRHPRRRLAGLDVLEGGSLTVLHGLVYAGEGARRLSRSR
jgi:hypothetical protein